MHTASDKLPGILNTQVIQGLTSSSTSAVAPPHRPSIGDARWPSLVGAAIPPGMKNCCPAMPLPHGHRQPLGCSL